MLVQLTQKKIIYVVIGVIILTLTITLPIVLLKKDSKKSRSKRLEQAVYLIFYNGRDLNGLKIYEIPLFPSRPDKTFPGTKNGHDPNHKYSYVHTSQYGGGASIVDRIRIDDLVKSFFVPEGYKMQLIFEVENESEDAKYVFTSGTYNIGSHGDEITRTGNHILLNEYGQRLIFKAITIEKDNQ